jgi:protocatechuate 3,4-dioxygenase beta subunit
MRQVVVTKLAIFLVSVPLYGAHLQCVVSDWESGRPLARTAITVEGAQPGPNAVRVSLRTDRVGAAMIGPIPDGTYLVTVARPGFATQQYGQSGWNRPGVPLTIQGNQPVPIQVRLRRLPSITGAVWDENEVGIPNAPVVVYTATRPAKLVGRVETDDRGFYRFGNLLPGSYVVRNAGKSFDDALSIVPTFYPDGSQISRARVLDIDLEHSAQDVNFSPAQGRLYRVSGRVTTTAFSPAGPVELISDTGRRTAGADRNGNFSFDEVAPGTYELFSQGERSAAWTRVVVDREQDGIRLEMYSLSPARIFAADQDGKRVDIQNMSLFARRKDLDADGPVVPLLDGRTILAPGNWEIAVSTSYNYYPVAVASLQQAGVYVPQGRADGWNLFTSQGTPGIRVALSTHPATVHGRVSFSVNNPAPGVPVYLETLDGNPEEPPQVRTARTDAEGNYIFSGLPPGRYGLISSYDADPTSRRSLSEAHPRAISLRESANESQDLKIAIR